MLVFLHTKKQTWIEYRTLSVAYDVIRNIASLLVKHWIVPYCKKQSFLKLFCSVSLKTTLNRAAKSVYNNLDIAHRRTQPCNGHRVMALCPGLPVWASTKETFTHTHQSWSSDILYQLSLSTVIHGPVLLIMKMSKISNIRYIGNLFWNTLWEFVKNDYRPTVSSLADN